MWENRAIDVGENRVGCGRTGPSMLVKTEVDVMHSTFLCSLGRGKQIGRMKSGLQGAIWGVEFLGLGAGGVAQG